MEPTRHPLASQQIPPIKEKDSDARQLLQYVEVTMAGDTRILGTVRHQPPQ